MMWRRRKRCWMRRDGRKMLTGIREKDGVKAILEFLYPTGDSVRQALAADTAQQLKEIGIDASIRGTGWDTAYDEAQSQPLLWGWGAAHADGIL